jgi:hypothetical protein
MFGLNFSHFPQHDWSVILVFCGPQVTTGPDPDPHARRVSQAGCHDRHGAAEEHGAAYFH